MNRHHIRDAAQALEISYLTPRELADLPPYHAATDDFLPARVYPRQRKGFAIRWPWSYGH